MGLPATVTELRQRLSELQLVSDGDFLSVVPTSPAISVAQAIAVLTATPAPWADGLHPNEPLLTKYQVGELSAGRDVSLCCEDWRIRSFLGDGGMGEVYAARDLRTNRIGAVKFLKPAKPEQNDDSGEQLLLRFERESRALLTLRHTGLPTLHSKGERNGVPYFVMEFIRGKTLKDIAESTHVDIDLATNWFGSLADIVGYIHQSGYIHRDVKPQNILVAEVDGRIVMLDLGLCRRVKVAQPQITYVAGGTPEYMPPENWDDPHLAAPPSDLYSLGCTFFFVLTGVPPFRGSVAQLRQKHHTEPPPRVRTLREDCPVWLDELVDRMLSKDPSARIQSAEELKSELLRLPPTVLGTQMAGFVQDQESISLELSMSKFEREVRSGLVRLRVFDALPKVLAPAVRDLERGVRTWTDLSVSSGTPFPTRLMALGELLKNIEAALDGSWPPDFRGAVVDNLSRHYTNTLAYLIGYLTEERLAQARLAKFWLGGLRREVETRLGHWMDALMGRRPYKHDLDQELCRSLQGPYHSPLALAVHRFDRNLALKFDEAVRQQIAMAGQDNGRMSVRDFLLEEAIPYWTIRVPLLQRETNELSTQVGEFLGELLAAIDISSMSALDCVPKAVKALLLDPEHGDAIRKEWTVGTTSRLERELNRLRKLAIADQAFGSRFKAVTECLCAAIHGDNRSAERIIFGDSSSRSALNGQLCHRNHESFALPCEILYLWSDLWGVCLRIGPPGSAATVPDSAMEMFAAGGNEIDSSRMLDDYFLRIALPNGGSFAFSVLESKWHIPSEMATVCVGAEVRNVDGHVMEFVEFIRSEFGYDLSPHDRFR